MFSIVYSGVPRPYGWHDGCLIRSTNIMRTYVHRRFCFALFVCLFVVVVFFFCFLFLVGSVFLVFCVVLCFLIFVSFFSLRSVSCIASVSGLSILDIATSVFVNVYLGKKTTVDEGSNLKSWLIIIIIIFIQVKGITCNSNALRQAHYTDDIWIYI